MTAGEPVPVPGAPFAVAVLTGGASRRMGRDKASLPIEGVAMAVRVAAAARAAGAVAVAAVGSPVEGCEHRPDDHPGEGPLGGLLTALRWAGDRPAVVLACDLVAPSAAAIRRVVARRQADEVDVAVPEAAGRAQWLHACWSPACEPVLSAAFAAGERSIHRAAGGLAVVRYAEAVEAALADADTEADLPAGGL